MKLLLFDIDGTLIKAGPSSEAAFEAAFEEQFGIAHCWGNTEPHGRTDPDIVQEICVATLGRRVSEEEYEELTKGYTSRLEPILASCNKYQVLLGVLRLCEELHNSANAALALETGNVEEAAYVKLRRGELAQYFPVGGFGSDHIERAEIVRISAERAVAHYSIGDLVPSRDVIVIGDAPQDIEAGKAFGASTIGVATGRYTTEQLKAFEADALFENLEDINRFFEFCGLKS